MAFEIVREFDLDYHTMEHSGSLVRIRNSKTGGVVFTHYLKLNPIALKVQEGFLCAGNMRTEERLFKIELQAHGVEQALHIEQLPMHLHITALKRHWLVSRRYCFDLGTCPIKLTLANTVLVLSCPLAQAPSGVLVVPPLWASITTYFQNNKA